MKKHYASEVDRIVAGIQSRVQARRTILRQAEAQYDVAKGYAQGGNREAGKLGKEIRIAIRPLALDQKLDVDTMKLLRACQSTVGSQARALDNIAGQAIDIITAAQFAFINLSK